MRKLLIVIVSIYFTFPVFGQKWKLTRYEAMIGIGSANYFGDIGSVTSTNNWYGLKDLSIRGVRPSFLAGVRYKITQETSVKLNFTLLMLGATDKSGTNVLRNYKFNTFGLEHSVQMEYSFLKEDRRKSSFAIYNRRGMLNSYSKIGLALFGGFGGLYYYPLVTKDSIYDVKRDIFKEEFLYTGVLLGGITAKMIFNNKLAFSVEFGARYAFTDFLDGFTSTVSKFNDIYYFGNFNIIYRIKTSRKGYPIIFRRY
jgi:hypothetical protein